MKQLSRSRPGPARQCRPTVTPLLVSPRLQRAAALDLGMSPDEAAVRTGIDRAVVDRVLARAAGVAWKHAVPHALS
jgi:hypothetical protein